MRNLLLCCCVVGAVILVYGQPARAVFQCGGLNPTDWCPDYENCVRGVIEYDACIGIAGQFRCVWEQEDNQGHHCYSDWEPCDCSGGNPGGSCFLAGTPITLADGSTKPVEAVREGDSVLEFEESTLAMKPGAVIGVHKPREVDEYLVMNENLRLTSNHLVLSAGKWVQAADLKVGDLLTAPGGTPVPLFSIHKVVGKVTVYNFQVSAGTYVAGGIIAHNKPLPYTLYPTEWE